MEYNAQTVLAVILHLSVEHVQIFRNPISGRVSFLHIPFGTLDDIEHMRRVYLYFELSAKIYNYDIYIN